MADHDPVWTALQSACDYGVSGAKGTSVSFGYEALSRNVEALIRDERARARREGLRRALQIVNAKNTDNRSLPARLALSSVAALIMAEMREAGETKEGG